MDIHRARFIPYPSPAINALAFSASNDSELSKGGLRNLRLAVGRENGDIEIWNPAKGAWTQERVFYGGRGRTIESLQWTQDPTEFEGNKPSQIGQLRLFSIGYSNAVTEWDLRSGMPLRQASSSPQEIWCFAAQPRLGNAEQLKAAKEGKYPHQDIVVGSADGSLALLSTAENDLQFVRFIARAHAAEARAISMAFRDRNIFAVGFANSSFRVYDLRNNSMLRDVSLGAGPRGGPKTLLVWALKWLPSGTLVTGDSAGEVRFFDGELYAQLQRIKAHDADILAVDCSQDGYRVFSAGMDRRTSVFQRTTKRHYSKSSHIYYHDHDVKAIAVYDGLKAQNMSLLTSGGLDTYLSIVPVSYHGEENHRRIPGLPQRPPVAVSTARRLVANWTGQEIKLWQVRESEKDEGQKFHRLVAQVGLKGEETIAAVCFSSDGELMAATTASETRVFTLTMNEADEGVTIRKVKTAKKLPGGTALQISPDGKWLSAVTQGNVIALYRIFRDDASEQRLVEKPFALEREGRRKEQIALQEYQTAITRHVFSPDSKVLVACELSGDLCSWQLEGEEDTAAPELEGVEDSDDDLSVDPSEDEDGPMKTFGQRWVYMESSRTLPRLDSAALILSFRPRREKEDGEAAGAANGVNGTKKSVSKSGTKDVEQQKVSYELFVLTSNHQLYEFDLGTGGLTAWSRRNPSDCLPKAFKIIKDRAMGHYWHNTSRAQRLYLYGSNWIYMFDVLQDLDRDESTEESLVVKSKKRKGEGQSGAGDKKREKDIKGFRTNFDEANDRPVKRQKIGTEGDPPMKDADDESEQEEDEDEVGLSRNLRGEEAGAKKAEDGLLKTWNTFSYRPILAIIPLEAEESHAEVVIVERPMWELDLPPKLMGPHERNR